MGDLESSRLERLGVRYIAHTQTIALGFLPDFSNLLLLDHSIAANRPAHVSLPTIESILTRVSQYPYTTTAFHHILHTDITTSNNNISPRYAGILSEMTGINVLGP